MSKRTFPCINPEMTPLSEGEILNNYGASWFNSVPFQEQRAYFIEKAKAGEMTVEAIFDIKQGQIARMVTIIEELRNRLSQ